MKQRLQRNIWAWAIYSAATYILLLPFALYVEAISISILIGFLFGILSDIVVELRKGNGEKF